MSVFISLEGSSAAVVIRIDGWLEDDDSEELMELVDANPRCVAIDLVELDSADAGGLKALRELRRRGIELRGLSGYLELLLRREQDAPRI